MSVFSEKQWIQEELETCLEKFLDILAEVEKMEDFHIQSFPPPSPKGLTGPGFAISFPFHQAAGLFLIAHREDLLPDWYRHPGVAGESRLLLFANHLSHYFSVDIEEDRSFFDSSSYFAGSVASLEEIFENLPFSPEASILPFQLRRWDGQSTYAWLMGPFSHIEISSQSLPVSQLVRRHASFLKPVRPLEGNETSLFYAPFSEELEEAADGSVSDEKNASFQEREAATVPPLPPSSQEESGQARKQELEEAIHATTSFTLSRRFRNLPTLHHLRRKEQILIRIQYAHPAHTQPWRKRVDATWKTLGKQLALSLTIPQEAELGALHETFLPTGILPEKGEWEYCTPSGSPHEVTTTLVLPPEEMPKIPPLPPALPPARIAEEQVLRIPATFSVVAARQKMSLQAFLQLRPGDILNFHQPMDGWMEIFVEHQKRGRGIPVEYEGRIGIQILEEEKIS